jgi:hypothetical protein
LAEKKIWTKKILAEEKFGRKKIGRKKTGRIKICLKKNWPEKKYWGSV